MSYLIDKESKRNIYVYALSIYFIALPLGAIKIGPLGSLLRLIALLPLGIWIIDNPRITLNSQIILLFLSTLWSAFTVFWALDFNIALERVISYSLLTTVVISASGYTLERSQLDLLKRSLVFSSRITVVIVIMFSTKYEGRLFLSNAYIEEDPNYICTYFLFGICSCFENVFILDNGTKKKILSGIELLLYFFIIILTGSRGGLIAAFTVIISRLIFVLKDRQLKVWHIFGIGFIILLLLYILNRFVSNELLYRFSLDNDSLKSGTGRYDIWEKHLECFRISNIFRKIAGHGSGNILAVNKYYYLGIKNVSHNVYIEKLLDEGVVGALIYVIFNISLLLKSIKSKEYYAFALLVGMFVMSFSTSIATLKSLWNVIIYTIMISLEFKNLKQHSCCYLRDCV